MKRRQALAELEMAPCTFHPALDPHSRALVTAMVSLHTFHAKRRLLPVTCACATTAHSPSPGPSQPCPGHWHGERTAHLAKAAANVIVDVCPGALSVPV